MSEKKRTTVTTIETHEVWIIRKEVPVHPDEHDMVITGEVSQAVVPSLGELNNSPEPNEEENHEEN